MKKKIRLTAKPDTQEAVRECVRKGVCPYCGQLIQMDWRRDAQYCPWCNVWLEEACDDENCEYCHGRPTYPLPYTLREQLHCSRKNWEVKRRE